MASTVTGGAQVRANIDRQVKAIGTAAVEGLHEAAKDGAVSAARHAPVVSGHLRDSLLGGNSDSLGTEGIRTGTDKRGPWAEFGSHADYAANIEYTDTPMIRPAAHEAELDLKETVAAPVRRTLSQRRTS